VASLFTSPSGKEKGKRLYSLLIREGGGRKNSLRKGKVNRRQKGDVDAAQFLAGERGIRREASPCISFRRKEEDSSLRRRGGERSQRNTIRRIIHVNVGIKGGRGGEKESVRSSSFFQVPKGKKREGRDDKKKEEKTQFKRLYGPNEGGKN